MFLAFLRTAQGTRLAPLTWARTIALVARLAQAIFSKNTSRLFVYVDDPISAVNGTQGQGNSSPSSSSPVWAALGFNLALPKAQLASRVTWTSAVLHVFVKSSRFGPHVGCGIIPELLEEVKDICKQYIRKQLIPRKTPRKLTGKAAHLANSVPMWRPCVAGLWGALSQNEDVSRAPSGQIWVKQIASSISWLLSFILEFQGTLVRRFKANAHARTGDAITMTFYASPWGAGGILEVDGCARRWFASKFAPCIQVFIRNSLVPLNASK